jgi:hypothetical protein
MNETFMDCQTQSQFPALCSVTRDSGKRRRAPGLAISRKVKLGDGADEVYSLRVYEMTQERKARLVKWICENFKTMPADAKKTIHDEGFPMHESDNQIKAFEVFL